MKLIKRDYYKPIVAKSSFASNYKHYESRGDRNKNLSVKEYIYMIMPYLPDMINNHKTTETQSGKLWKIQISMRVNFTSSKDTEETSHYLCME